MTVVPFYGSGTGRISLLLGSKNASDTQAVMIDVGSFLACGNTMLAQADVVALIDADAAAPKARGA